MTPPDGQSAAWSFVVAIDGFDAEADEPGSRGSAIVLGPHHLLTCWHVVQRREGTPWGLSDRREDAPWARLTLAQHSSATPLECVGWDSTLDVALLYSPAELKFPVAQWLDTASMHDWLKRLSSWVALGFPETTRQICRHRGTGLLGENRDYLQLPGGIPAGFSGGALMLQRVDLCAGLIQLGGRKSPVSVALSIEAIEKFLLRFRDRDSVELTRVPGPRPPPGDERSNIRWKSNGRMLAVGGVILSVVGMLAGAWGVWNSRANERPSPPAPLHVEQTVAHTTQRTDKDYSPNVANNTGTVNVVVTPPGGAASK